MPPCHQAKGRLSLPLRPDVGRGPRHASSADDQGIAGDEGAREGRHRGSPGELVPAVAPTLRLARLSPFGPLHSLIGREERKNMKRILMAAFVAGALSVSVSAEAQHAAHGDHSKTSAAAALRQDMRQLW